MGPGLRSGGVTSVNQSLLLKSRNPGHDSHIIIHLHDRSETCSSPSGDRSDGAGQRAGGRDADGTVSAREEDVTGGRLAPAEGG